MLGSFWDSVRFLNRSERKPKRPRAPRPLTRWTHLEIEPLEKRELFSSSPWQSQPPFLDGQVAAFDQDIWFVPLGRIFTAFSGDLTNASINSAGTFLYTLSGTYTFGLHISGTSG